MDKSTRISFALFAVGATALVSACSGSTDAEDPTATTTPTNSTSPTQTRTTTTTASAAATDGPTAPEATVATDRYPDATGACELFAPSQVTLIVEGEGTPDADDDECEVEGPNDHSVDVSVSPLRSIVFYRDLDGFKSNLEERGMVAIEGIGDAAYWNPNDGAIKETEMFVAVGDDFAQISIDLHRPNLDNRPTADGLRAMIVPLAMTAADRLPLAR